MTSLEPADRRARAMIGLAFALSRGIFFAAGVRFDSSALPWFWQYVEPQLLRTDLSRSLFYLHSQPPAFNLFLGVVLKAAPAASTTVFALAYLALGLALHLGLYALLVRLRTPPTWALAFTLLFLVSPSAVLYENWLSSALPVTTALVLAALALHRYLTSWRALDGTVFVALLAAVAFTHSLFHLAWCVAAGLALVWLSPPAHRRRAATLALIPVALAGALYLKNWFLFGQFSSSSWAGMSLAKVAFDRAPLAERKRLVATGKLSALALVRPFSHLNAYPESFSRIATPPVPVLSRPEKPGGFQNLNHLAYLEISRQYLRDVRAFVELRPGFYTRNVGLAFAIYTTPSSANVFLTANRERIEPYERLFNRWCLGAADSWFGLDRRPPVPGYPHMRLQSAFLWMLMFGLATLFGLRRGLESVRHSELGPALGGTILFLAGNVVYVTAVANLLEIGENNRIRFMVDPLALALVGALCAPLLARARQRRRA